MASSTYKNGRKKGHWIAPARTVPYTPEELMQMKRDGDALSVIFGRAKRVNGMSRAEVRRVLFGREY